jgi:hypothetical protein
MKAAGVLAVGVLFSVVYILTLDAEPIQTVIVSSTYRFPEIALNDDVCRIRHLPSFRASNEL